jgi:CubicO group peptidase (beta-lactamase class C family)
VKNQFYIANILFLVLILISCRDKSSIEPEVITYVYEIPEQIDDGWEVGSVEEVSLNVNNLTEMINEIDEISNHRIHSILISKDSKLVFEKYFEGYLFDANYVQSEGDLINYDLSTLHYLASVSKSVTSLLFGIAIDNGAELDIKKSLQSYYPEYASVLVGEKANITVEHILTMTAGLSWDESTYSYGDIRNDVTQLFLQEDPIKYVLEKPLESVHGNNFSYNSGYTNILSHLIQKTTGISFQLFAENNLFAPLKIDNYKWDKLNDNLIFASGGLYLSSRNLAKMGQLFLNDGEWEGNQIVSKEWIDLSTQSYINPYYYNFSNGYGFQWWNYTFNTIYDSHECFFAAGWGDQFLYVIPSENMSIVITSGNFFDNAEISPHAIVHDYILYALEN